MSGSKLSISRSGIDIASDSFPTNDPTSGKTMARITAVHLSRATGSIPVNYQIAFTLTCNMLKVEVSSSEIGPDAPNPLLPTSTATSMHTATFDDSKTWNTAPDRMAKAAQRLAPATACFYTMLKHFTRDDSV